MQTFHGQRPTPRCQVCGNNFSHPYSLRVHLEGKHDWSRYDAKQGTADPTFQPAQLQPQAIGNIAANPAVVALRQADAEEIAQLKRELADANQQIARMEQEGQEMSRWIAMLEVLAGLRTEE